MKPGRRRERKSTCALLLAAAADAVPAALATARSTSSSEDLNGSARRMVAIRRQPTRLAKSRILHHQRQQHKPQQLEVKRKNRTRRNLGPKQQIQAAYRYRTMSSFDNVTGHHQMDLIKSASRKHLWNWDINNKSHECLVSEDKLEVCFHPKCSESAAAIIGSEPLKRNGNYYFWEITVFDKTYGTSVMFGICTKKQALHANDYCNLIGLDDQGWSLSHKGTIWHNGKPTQYTQAFPANQTVTICILLNTMRGELSYFMNGQNLGVAFNGLNDIDGEIYPVIGSTAKCTRMRLNGAYCGYVSLMERSCFTLLKNFDKEALPEYLKDNRVPKVLYNYITETAIRSVKSSS